MFRVLVLLCVMAFCPIALAAPTDDTGNIGRIFAKDGGWWVELSQGMPNALADRTCRLELFYTTSENVAQILLFSIQNSMQVTIRSVACESNSSGGTNAYHRIDTASIVPIP